MKLTSKDLQEIRQFAIDNLFQMTNSQTLYDLDAPMNDVQRNTMAHLKAVLSFLKKRGVIEEVPEMLKELL